MDKQKNLNVLITAVTILVIFLCIYILMKLSPMWKPLLRVLATVITPFFIAGFITYLLHPIIERIHEKGIPRPIAILLIFILFFAGVGYGLYIGVPQVIQQLRDLLKNLPHFMETYRGWIDIVNQQTEEFPDGLHKQIEEIFVGVETAAENGIKKILASLVGLLDYLFLFAIIPFLVFYLLKDVELIKKMAWYLTPRKWREHGHRLLVDINESLGSYIRGQLFVCAIIGVVAAMSLWLMDMKYPLLLGGIIGITNIIPYFGPIIGAIPAVIIAATVSVKMVVIVAVIILGLQVLEGNLLSPLIVGKSIHMHPVMIILALLIGEQVAGVLGLILSVPLFAVLKVILLHIKLSYAKH